MWVFFYRDCKRRLDKQTCELLSAELSNTELVTTELLKNELVDTWIKSSLFRFQNYNDQLSSS